MNFAINVFTERLQFDTSGLLKRQLLWEIVTQTATSATSEK